MADDEQDNDGTPTFGEVVKAFTPPGTDFEAFKESLHSTGAPARIAPEMVAMLNAAAPHMGVPAEGDTGSRCFRCEHRHLGPPGQKCLEAEAFYGRSPYRRSPDLQLDGVRKLSQSEQVRVPDCPPLPATVSEPPGMASAAAIAAHEMWTDFVAAGFTEDHALKLVALLIKGSDSTDDGHDGRPY